MNRFIVIEVEDGMTVVELPAGENPTDVAYANNGYLADEQVYDSYDQAYDALIELSEDEDYHEESPY